MQNDQETVKAIYPKHGRSRVILLLVSLILTLLVVILYYLNLNFFAKPESEKNNEVELFVTDGKTNTPPDAVITERIKFLENNITDRFDEEKLNLLKWDRYGFGGGSDVRLDKEEMVMEVTPENEHAAILMTLIKEFDQDFDFSFKLNVEFINGESNFRVVYHDGGEPWVQFRTVAFYDNFGNLMARVLSDSDDEVVGGDTLVVPNGTLNIRMVREGEKFSYFIGDSEFRETVGDFDGIGMISLIAESQGGAGDSIRVRIDDVALKLNK